MLSDESGGQGIDVSFPINSFGKNFLRNPLTCSAQCAGALKLFLLEGHSLFVTIYSIKTPRYTFSEIDISLKKWTNYLINEAMLQRTIKNRTWHEIEYRFDVLRETNSDHVEVCNKH